MINFRFGVRIIQQRVIPDLTKLEFADHKRKRFGSIARNPLHLRKCVVGLEQFELTRHNGNIERSWKVGREIESQGLKHGSLQRDRTCWIGSDQTPADVQPGRCREPQTNEMSLPISSPA